MLQFTDVFHKDGSSSTSIQCRYCRLKITSTRMSHLQAPGPTGLLASFDSGVTTDIHWACTSLSGPPTDPLTPWALSEYDDSAWGPAQVSTCACV